MAFGLVAQRLSPINSILIVDVSVVALLVFLIFSSIAAQLIASIIYAFLSVAFFLIVPVYCQLYSPPEMYGVIFGLWMGVVGIFQIVAEPIENSIALAITPQERWQLIGKQSFWTLVTVVFAAGNVCVWFRIPPPTLGTVSMADVWQARHGSVV